MARSPDARSPADVRDAGVEAALRAARRQGIVRRFLVTQRHLVGLALGGAIAWVRHRREEGRNRGWTYRAVAVFAFLVRPFVDREFRNEPFPVQLRRRLEVMGPTYVKLGQIMSLREDILPRSITGELANLLDRLPAVPFPVIRQVIADDLGRTVDEMFAEIEPEPIGSASIAQAHRAVTREGDRVIVKVVKPGIREILERDAVLLRLSGRLLQAFLPRYQPRRIIDEFCDYTLREVDLRREADNAETFSANFRDEPDIVFPRIFRAYSGERVLCMEFLDGFRPDAPAAESLSLAERRRLIDLGAAAILRMLYQDGFFHADLHPGNLLVLRDPETGRLRVGFIDLGMVGRIDEELRRLLLYYYFSLVSGDAENAARFLANAAEIGAGSDPHGFRREVEEISRRWRLHASFREYSIGRMILESLAAGAQFRVYFPVEMVLMVKALVTYEGVGHLLLPGFDVVEVSTPHIRRLFLTQFNPLRLVREGVRVAPEIFDAMVKAPLLVTEGLRVLEKTTRRPPENPLAGLRGSVIAAACLVSGAIVLTTGGPWPAWSVLFLLALVLALRRGER
ncbi:MAG: AarF/UbiB family protein [Acidobacteriota bacterium]|nr:MAG: AarF/ABC1/UbiB kinase family protein [Acidobacteriota bacterium]